MPHPLDPLNRPDCIWVSLRARYLTGPRRLTECGPARCAAAFARLPHAAMLHRAARELYSHLGITRCRLGSRVGDQREILLADEARRHVAGLLALIELTRVSRHFEATDEIGIARCARRFGTDAIGLFARQKHRPFVDQFFAASPVRFAHIARKQDSARPSRTDLMPAAQCRDIPDRRSNRGPLAIARAERRSVEQLRLPR